MNRIVHFELNSPDPDKSLPFFADAFGWTFNTFGDTGFAYHLTKTGETDSPGIDGAIMQSQDGQPRTVNIVDVEDIDAATEKLTSLGGTCVVPKIAIPGVGYSAYFTDPAGILFGIYQADSSVSV